MGKDEGASGPKREFVGGATFSNDISATIPLVQLKVGAERLEFRFRGPLGWFIQPRTLGREDVEAVHPPRAGCSALRGLWTSSPVRRAARGGSSYPLAEVEAVLEAMEACGYPVGWRQHDRLGKPI